MSEELISRVRCHGNYYSAKNRELHFRKVIKSRLSGIPFCNCKVSPEVLQGTVLFPLSERIGTSACCTTNYVPCIVSPLTPSASGHKKPRVHAPNGKWEMECQWSAQFDFLTGISGVFLLTISNPCRRVDNVCCGISNAYYTNRA